MKILKINTMGDHKILRIVYEGGHIDTITPNQDVSNKSDEVKEAVTEHHTDEIKATYQAMLDANAPAPLTDAEIIKQGVNAISDIVTAAYTDKVWKSASYTAKKGEADYVLSLTKDVAIDETKCRLITAEATEKSIDIRILATAVDGKVKQYEALVLGAGQAEQILENAIPKAENQVAKMATKDQIIAGFKRVISGE
ncbi:MAG: hypothetical protein HRU28_05560 [Rhizobiales bacterium]|nr:hypothetical protein [Hyphomicrobiales bacterium]